MWVGFLYTEASSELSGPGATKLSKNGIDLLLLETSVVTCICGSMELMWCKNCWLCSAFWMAKVSSKYLSQSLRGFGGVLMAMDSNPSMNRLATMVLMRDPIAAP